VKRTRAVRQFFFDLVVQSLPVASVTRADVPAQIAMKLLDIARLEWDAGAVGVDRREHVPVTGDLLLGAIPRCRLLGDERFDTRKWGVDVLDCVRCLGALNQRCLAQRLEAGWVLLAIEIRSPPSLRDTRQRGHDPRRQSAEVAG
jgi:hypothetical protein